MNISLVIDLGFGDSGKGITVDYLSAKNVNDSLVVRFSGGHQVGHTVKKGSFSHTFCNFGSGSLRGVPTYYTEQTTIFPPAILAEYSVLENYKPQLVLDPMCMVTTPYDIVYNIAREKYFGHGSCGVGYAATVERNERGIKLYAKDLKFNWVLREKLKAIKQYYEHKLTLCGEEWFRSEYDAEIFDFDERKFIDSCEESLKCFKIKPFEEIFPYYKNIVFEGNQGIMLDQFHGIFPHVTRSFTTSKTALEFIKKFDALKNEKIDIYYITRCYQTRHGNGPMSSNTPIVLINNENEANIDNKYQGDFRTSRLDFDLLNYALTSDRVYHRNNTIFCHLVVTCLDQLPSFKTDELLSSLNCKFISVLGSYSQNSKDFKLLSSYQTILAKR